MVDLPNAYSGGRNLGRSIDIIATMPMPAGVAFASGAGVVSLTTVTMMKHPAINLQAASWQRHQPIPSHHWSFWRREVHHCWHLHLVLLRMELVKKIIATMPMPAGVAFASGAGVVSLTTVTMMKFSWGPLPWPYTAEVSNPMLVYHQFHH
jgi:hypothetical protein